MNKIIPVIMLIMSVMTVVLSAIALTVMCVAVRVSGVALVAVPTAIVSVVLSLLGAPFAFLFKRDRLCYISFFVYATAFVLSAVAVGVWFVAL